MPRFKVSQYRLEQAVITEAPEGKTAIQIFTDQRQLAGVPVLHKDILRSEKLPDIRQKESPQTEAKA